MLERLTVENYALIERLEMQLDESLNIITGETGAGKSILLGALGLLLGAKNDGTATRDNTKSCIVEGVFRLTGLDLESLFAEQDWEYEEQVTIRRVITPAGKSRTFVGDIPVSLSDVKMLSSRLIDIHSQHQNQILADENFRVGALDMLYNSTPLLSNYQSEYESLKALRAELHRIEQIAESARRDEEWLSHQVEELTAANLRVGESEEAEAELHILENAESIGEVLTNFIAAADGDDERAILSQLRGLEREMRTLTKSLPSAEEYCERLRGVIEEVKDLNSTIISQSETIEVNPERLTRLSERIDTLYTLCQKHRCNTIEELIEVRDRYAEQLLTILNSDDQINALRRDIEASQRRVEQIAGEISRERQNVATPFAKEVIGILHRLGMERAQFRVEISSSPLTNSGCDEVQYLFSSVEGKAPQSADKIASGGEVSRLMLAIKSIIAKHRNLPTIIFDEIDTGVSGRIADAMGEIIEELSSDIQVIDITHLPQIASKGSSHFVVYKESDHTNITKLTAQERVTHIATMISGSEVTPAALEQASILLGE